MLQDILDKYYNVPQIRSKYNTENILALAHFCLWSTIQFIDVLKITMNDRTKLKWKTFLMVINAVGIWKCIFNQKNLCSTEMLFEAGKFGDVYFLLHAPEY